MITSKQFLSDKVSYVSLNLSVHDSGHYYFFLEKILLMVISTLNFFFLLVGMEIRTIKLSGTIKCMYACLIRLYNADNFCYNFRDLSLNASELFGPPISSISMSRDYLSENEK